VTSAGFCISRFLQPSINSKVCNRSFSTPLHLQVAQLIYPPAEDQEKLEISIEAGSTDEENAAFLDQSPEAGPNASLPAVPDGTHLLLQCIDSIWRLLESRAGHPHC